MPGIKPFGVALKPVYGCKNPSGAVFNGGRVWGADVQGSRGTLMLFWGL